MVVEQKKQRSPVDRRKRVFDRRSNLKGLRRIFNHWLGCNLERLILGKKRSGIERRQIGERRKDWIRYSPYCSTYSPVRGKMKEFV